MNNLDHRRRAADSGSGSRATNADIVTRGILLRHASSTVAAVEYLTARGIGAAVIRRAMSGQALRDADRQALVLQQSFHKPPGS